MGRGGYEVICVDDCSTDNTIEIIKNAQKHHSNLRLLTNPYNKRAGGSRNHGVREAKGEYIMFIDADDYYHPSSLKQAIEYLSTHELDILMCDNSRGHVNHIKQKGIHLNYNTSILSGKDFFKINGCPFAPWKFIFKKELMIDNHIFFREHVQVEDIDWVINIVLHANSIQYQPIILIHYVLTANSLTASTFNIHNFNDTIECANCLYLLSSQIYNSDSEISEKILNLSNFYYKVGH